MSDTSAPDPTETPAATAPIPAVAPARSTLTWLIPVVVAVGLVAALLVGGIGGFMVGRVTAFHHGVRIQQVGPDFPDGGPWGERDGGNWRPGDRDHVRWPVQTPTDRPGS